MITSHPLENEKQHAIYQAQTQYWDAAFVTDPGGRAENQDFFGCFQSHDGAAVFCVADGLGGHAGGRVASQIAVEAIGQFVLTDHYRSDDPETLVKAFIAANNAIIAAQKRSPELSTMRTTLVVLVIKDGLAFWAHVGDVRLYHFRDGKLSFQSRDHSVPQMLADAGEISTDQIRNHPDRSKLLNALGSDPCKPSIPLQYTQLRQGDMFHLSTDGFWEWVTEKQLMTLLGNANSMQAALRLMEAHIRRKALETEPEYDNYTGLNIRILTAEKNIMHWNKTTYIKGSL